MGACHAAQQSWILVTMRCHERAIPMQKYLFPIRLQWVRRRLFAQRGANSAKEGIRAGKSVRCRVACGMLLAKGAVFRGKWRSAVHPSSQRAASAIAAYCVPMSENAQKTEEREAHIQRAQYSIHDSPLGRAERSILPIRNSPLHKTTNRSPTGSSPPKGRLTRGFSLPFSSFIHRNAPFRFPIRRKMCNFAHSLSD